MTDIPFPNINFPKHLIPNQVKQIIFNLKNYILSNGILNGNFASKASISSEIVKYTGLNYITVYNVLYKGEENVDVDNNNIIKSKGGVKPKGKFKRIDNFIKSAIPRKIYRGFECKKRYTLESLLVELNQDFANQGGFPYKITTLRLILRLLGFRYKKISEQENKMNRRDLIQWRMKFLRNMKEHRERGSHICWLDETWFDTHDSDARGWTDSTEKCTFKLPGTRGKRLIILNAGSENGWIPNCQLFAARELKLSHADYHQDMDGELFENWFKNQLLPNLPPKSVICMDNASYHSRLLLKIPRKGTRKDEILGFMDVMGFKIPEPIPKISELLKIIEKEKIQNDYKIDELAKSAGHIVERIPPYHCLFNPIEIIWGLIKNEVRKRNMHPKNSDGVIDLIKEVMVNNITANVWKNCCGHTKKIEKKYFGSGNPIKIKDIVIKVNDLEDDSDSDIEPEIASTSTTTIPRSPATITTVPRLSPATTTVPRLSQGTTTTTVPRLSPATTTTVPRLSPATTTTTVPRLSPATTTTISRLSPASTTTTVPRLSSATTTTKVPRLSPATTTTISRLNPATTITVPRLSSLTATTSTQSSTTKSLKHKLATTTILNSTTPDKTKKEKENLSGPSPQPAKKSRRSIALKNSNVYNRCYSNFE